MFSWADLLKLLFISLIHHFPDSLTYLLLYPKMASWVDLTHFFRILHIYHFSGFPYLLLLKDVTLINIFLSYLAYSPLLRIYLPTYYFFKECQAESTQYFFRISFIHCFSGLTYLRTTFFERCQALSKSCPSYIQSYTGRLSEFALGKHTQKWVGWSEKA